MSDDRAVETAATTESSAEHPDERDSGSSEVLSEFFSTFTGPGYRFIINRKDPKTFLIAGQLRRVGGHMETLEQPPTLDYLSEVWGGGIYEVKVMGPAKEGKGLRYIASRTIEIVGDPKLKPGTFEDRTHAGPMVSQDPELVHRVLDQTYEDKRRAEERLEQERRRSELDRKSDRTTPA